MVRKRECEMLDTLQRIELDEGGEIWLRIAGPYPRALALLIDTLVIFAGMVIFAILLGLMGAATGTGTVMAGILMIVAFFVSWGYFTYFECGPRGATIGKRALGLRVLDRSGNSATRGQIFVRNILRMVDMLPGIPTTSLGFLVGSFTLGFFCCIFTKRFQRIGDLVANTVVVYTMPEFSMVGAQPNITESVPPPVKLSREEQQAITDFSSRAGLWSEARRLEISDHAQELTKRRGMAGMVRLLGMAKWIRERG